MFNPNESKKEVFQDTSEVRGLIEKPETIDQADRDVAEGDFEELD